MKQRRLARLTCHTYPAPDWPEDEFNATETRLPSGQRSTIQLAERGTQLSNRLWVREFRKLTQTGQQTTFLSTGSRGSAALLAVMMFKRWSQENFLRYMRQSYRQDGLVDYGVGAIPETTMVANPAHRALDGQVRKAVGLLRRQTAEYGAINLADAIEPRKVKAFVQGKSDLRDSIAALQSEVADLKAQRKATDKHIAYGALPEAVRFDRLSTQSKHLIDTIQMIAYRAGTPWRRSFTRRRHVMTTRAACCASSTAPGSISGRISNPKR